MRGSSVPHHWASELPHGPDHSSPAAAQLESAFQVLTFSSIRGTLVYLVATACTVMPSKAGKRASALRYMSLTPKLDGLVVRWSRKHPPCAPTSTEAKPAWSSM